MRNSGAATAILAFSLLALAASAAAAQETILYDFGAHGTPAAPNTTPVFDAAGNLYGTAPGGFTATGSALNAAVAYELSPNSEGAWTEKELYVFSKESSGLKPNGLIFDAKKINLYGTAQTGGKNNHGAVFELSPNKDGTWTETVLYSFAANGYDGNDPEAGLIFDTSGNLYGTTSSGGSYSEGTVFELSPEGNGIWTENVLYSFQNDGSDGMSPNSALVLGAGGALYGTTSGGGDPQGLGTVFELAPGNYGILHEQVLHTFAMEGSGDAATPVGGLAINKAGNLLYGAAAGGGAHKNGAVYELSTANSVWTYALAYSFNGTSGSTEGTSPEGGVVLDSKGNLFGTTSHGGTYGSDGTVYELTPSGASWTEKVQYDFVDYDLNDGFDPAGNPTLDSKGNLYGVCTKGGTDGQGTAFKIATNLALAATPAFSPAAGIYGPGTAVKIKDATPGATIYYTINGDTPTAASTKYTNAIAVSATETIKAVALATGYAESAVGSAKYTIEPVTAEPAISPSAGQYAAPQSVKITDKTAGAVIYYTTSGATPTTTSKKYASAITVLANETIKAMAIAPGHVASAVATSAYTIETALPVISPNGGTFAAAQTVKISDATAGAAIYYTTNGGAPTTASKKYTGTIAVSANETIKAIAIAPAHAQSGVASAAFKIEAALPVISPNGGTFTGAQTVKISDATVGAAIYYTTNGGTPTTASKKYASAITVSASETIKAIAIATGYASSAVASAKFTIN